MDDVPDARQRTGPELGKWYNPLRDRTRSDIRERPFNPKVVGSRPTRPTRYSQFIGHVTWDYWR
jgi:hypothetical protein